MLFRSEYFVRNVGKDRKGDLDLTLTGELVDRDGKKLIELASPIRGPHYLGGSDFYGTFSFQLPMDQPPGEYKARARLTDMVTGRRVNFEHPVYVLSPEFGAVRVRLTHDKEGKWPAGSHLTVGQEFFVQMRIVNPEHKEGSIHVSVKLSALDRDGKDTMLTPIEPAPINQKVNDAFNFFDLSSGSMRTILSGEAVIKVALEDMISGKKVSYELPVVIHPPRSRRASK